MPQSERSQIMKELLRWLHAKSKSSNGARTGEILTHVMSEISSLGATKRAARSYIETLAQLGFIRVYRLKWKLTSKGENWLKRKLDS